eukprot:Lithocolla_globosa_v1_NODE_203_length_5193_cov_233.144998.p3 type:complete len:117 gc:universal NODE_203_length_5193_cov_233.144998:3645-3995(+)
MQSHTQASMLFKNCVKDRDTKQQERKECNKKQHHPQQRVNCSLKRSLDCALFMVLGSRNVLWRREINNRYRFLFINVTGNTSADTQFGQNDSSRTDFVSDWVKTAINPSIKAREQR